MPALIRQRIDDGVMIIEIDNPPVNATSHGVRIGLLQALRSANDDAAIIAIVLTGTGRIFIGGADLREQGQMPQPPLLADVCDAIEQSGKPVIAAIQGTALGGGLEIAISAHARIAAPHATLGFPEVSLGLIPGAGGTQRTPRLIGLSKTIELICGGKAVAAADALAVNLIDGISADLPKDAIARARELVGTQLCRTRSRPIPSEDAAELERQIENVTRKSAKRLAVQRAIDAVLASTTLNFTDGRQREREIFESLVVSDQAVALRHVFFAEREVSRIKADSAPRSVNRVGVVGTGTMGASIAALCLMAGYHVDIVERDAEMLRQGRERVETVVRRLARTKTNAETAAREVLLCLSSSLNLDSLASADLVIEAVFDELSLKRGLFRDLERIVSRDAILATNTSYLDPNEIVQAIEHPDRFICMHFFSPAHAMRLVEIASLGRTTDETLVTALAVAKRLGKLPVPISACEGFVGNRIFSAYRKQCEYLLEEGAFPHEVDAAMEDFGFPMGPFTVSDLAGLDISWARRKRLAAKRPQGERYVEIADILCEMGRFGRKNGFGWYRYDGGDRQVDQTTNDIVRCASHKKGITRRPIASDEIQRRALAAMVHEATVLIEEGIVTNSSAVDVILIHGFGYPATRGGPMFDARRIGFAEVLSAVEEMAARDGSGWEPTAVLKRLALEGG